MQLTAWVQCQVRICSNWSDLNIIFNNQFYLKALWKIIVPKLHLLEHKVSELVLAQTVGINGAIHWKVRAAKYVQVNVSLLYKITAVLLVYVAVNLKQKYFFIFVVYYYTFLSLFVKSSNSRPFEV